MTRVLRLTLIAPDIVEAVLIGNKGLEMTLARVLEPFHSNWERQAGHFFLVPLERRAFPRLDILECTGQVGDPDSRVFQVKCREGLIHDKGLCGAPGRNDADGL